MQRILLLFLALICTGCARQDSLDLILARGELQVVSRNSPTTWYIDKQGPTGFEYALTEMFAEELGVAVRVTPAHSLDEIFPTAWATTA